MSLIKVLLLINLLFVWYRLEASESNSKSLVYITSNVASYNDKTKIGIYEGDVITVRKNLHINSDKLLTYFKLGKIEKIIFQGQPVKFRHKADKIEEEIYGEALIAEYYPSANKFVFLEEAVFTQGGNRSASRRVVYFAKNKLIKAGDKLSSDKRVYSVFMPDKQNETEQ